MRKIVSCAYNMDTVRGIVVLGWEHVLHRLHRGGELGGSEYV